MPRGRPRKPRLSRMDAAVDAMIPYGFPQEKVRKHVKELLKEYGGNEGWPFIEEYSYKELIDAILRGDTEGNDQEQVAEHDQQLKDKSFEDERPEDDGPADIAGSSSAVADPECNEPVISSSGISNAEGVGQDWEDIIPDQTSGHIKASQKDKPSEMKEQNSCITASQSVNNILPFQPPTKNVPTRRRMPCYGWIERDEDEDLDDFIVLKPAPSKVGPKATLHRELSKSSNDGNISSRKRRSRWD